MASNRTLTAIEGVRVGHAQDRRRRTGSTVVLLDPPAMAFADARGGWPGTYDTAASDLGKTFIDRHALLLTGGDVYGFDAVGGIRRFILEKKLAAPTGGGEMPGIKGANIYDIRDPGYGRERLSRDGRCARRLRETVHDPLRHDDRSGGHGCPSRPRATRTPRRTRS